MAQLWGMEPTADEIRTWLRDVLTQTGLTPTELARKSGVSPSTLLRFLGGAGVLSFRSAAKVAHASGSRVPMSAEQAAPGGLSEVEGEPFLYDREEVPKTPLEGAIQALIGERQAADPWLLFSTVLEDAGYLPGDILIVDLNATPMRGDAICAQVYQWTKGTAETVFRVYEPPYLLAATRNAGARKPFFVDNDRVIIKGVVTDALRTKKENISKHISN